jgi:hypothetical protein
MKNFKFILRTALVLAAFFTLFQGVEAQNRTDRALINEAQRITRDEFPHFTVTPQGTRIYSVTQPNTQMIAAIDRGLNDLFTLARKYRYTNRLNHSDYTIFIARADRQRNRDNQYSPDIAINAGQYAGSVYDQGGYVYAAGMVLAFNPNAFIIAEHTRDFQRVSEVVRYEGEHLVLYHNDRRLYQQTADHSQGGGHPILK